MMRVGFFVLQHYIGTMKRSRGRGPSRLLGARIKEKDMPDVEAMMQREGYATVTECVRSLLSREVGRDL